MLAILTASSLRCHFAFESSLPLCTDVSPVMVTLAAMQTEWASQAVSLQSSVAASQINFQPLRLSAVRDCRQHLLILLYTYSSCASPAIEDWLWRPALYEAFRHNSCTMYLTRSALCTQGSGWYTESRPHSKAQDKC